jgi:hypothetical protein
MKIMNTHADKTQENKSQSITSDTSQKQGSDKATFQFVDNRPEVVAQRKLQEMANNSQQVSQLKVFQDMANNSPQAKQTNQLQAIVQRKLYKDGGKNAVAVPGSAKRIAIWVTTKSSIQPGGKNHLPNIQNRGFLGFKKGKDEHAGGKPFEGNMRDGHKLPLSATYQEWDLNPCTQGQGRDGLRVVTSSDGKYYYTSNHYTDFTEFTL